MSEVNNGNIRVSRRSKFADSKLETVLVFRTSDNRYGVGDLSGAECSGIADSNQQRP